MNEPTLTPPIERIFDLSDLSDAGAEIRIAPPNADLVRLAEWAEVVEVESFEATIVLKRVGLNHFRYEGHLLAAIVQSCVVTLEPVRSRIDRTFSRNLHLVRHVRQPEMGGEVPLGAADDEAPEEIESARFDVAGPVLEEFALAIDPYPRAPGVAFEAPSAGGQVVVESPFAVLKQLKKDE